MVFDPVLTRRIGRRKAPDLTIILAGPGSGWHQSGSYPDAQLPILRCRSGGPAQVFGALRRLTWHIGGDKMFVEYLNTQHMINDRIELDPGGGAGIPVFMRGKQRRYAASVQQSGGVKRRA